MSELPKGWTAASLAEIAQVIMGQAPAGENCNEEGNGLPFFQGKAEFQKLYPEIRKFCSAPTKVAEQDDILLSIRAPVGPTNLAPEKCCIGRGLAGVRADESIDQKYLLHFFRHIEPWLSQQGTGSTFKAINGDQVRGLIVSLAPCSEQTRIAQKLDELLAQVDPLKARIDAIPALLKRFRQSVLAAAIDGTLTEGWRQRSGIAFEWSTVVFSDLLREFRGGASKKPSDLMEGVPVIRSSAVRSMTVDFSDIRYFDSETELNERDFALEGDLLFTRLSGSPEFVGVCALVRTAPRRPTQFPDRLFCARLKDKNHGPYLEIFFASRAYLGYIRDNLKSSAGHQRITTEIVKSTLILLPSIAEQAEIVRRVEQLFAFADQLEAKVASAKSRIDHLTQSILAKAFRGELVPQDPNDEPASLLLERIQAQRAAAPKAKRSRKVSA